MSPEDQQAYLLRQKRKNTVVGFSVVGFVVLVFLITLLKQGFFV